MRQLTPYTRRARVCGTGWLIRMGGMDNAMPRYGQGGWERPELDNHSRGAKANAFDFSGATKQAITAHVSRRLESGPPEAPRGGKIRQPSLCGDYAGKSAAHARAGTSGKLPRLPRASGNFREPAASSVSQQQVPLASRNFREPAETSVPSRKFRTPAGSSVRQREVPYASRKFRTPAGSSVRQQEVPYASRKFRTPAGSSNRQQEVQIGSRKFK